ncbi:MAG: beta-N-acetylhexosaminidase [Candidatus Riflebacteria bacterium]|nr:beta-N-acetylhexosaminidase [Candidatus Riflebacteria bacterium]
MDKKQIGQLFIVGYQGEEPSSEFLRFVEEWGIGGVIVFARNLSDPGQLPAHLARINEAAGQQVFTSIDQEGGLVLRILSRGSLFPSAMALSATDSLTLTEQCHEAIGREMLSLGLNWNLAPVLDINHPDNPGIGARSFSDSPQRVADFGCAAIRGLQKAGVLACAKHFPGKGHARVDSHLTLPVIPYDTERLAQFELLPFRKAIEAGVDAIMTAHVFFPAYENTKDLPATLSQPVLTGLLRERLGFDGILVTDDLEMGAITESFGIAQAASMSFHAGADLLLICHSIDQQRLAAETISRSLSGNSKTGKRLEESLQRISRARSRLTTGEARTELYKLKEQHAPLIERVHAESVRFLRYESNMLPLDESAGRTIFCVPQISALVQVEEEHRQESLKSLIAQEFPAAETIVYEPKAGGATLIDQIGQEIGSINDRVQIVFFTYNAHIFKGQNEAIKHFSRLTPRFSVAALRNPYDLASLQQIKTCAATFGFRTPAIKALLKAFKGETPPVTSPWPIDIANW